MRRREFMALLGGSAVALPLATRAQQTELPGSRPSPQHVACAICESRRGVAPGTGGSGFRRGPECRHRIPYADNQPDRLPALAAELIRRPVNVIIANSSAANAAKAATTTVPIVFAVGNDPVRDRLVPNMNRPGSNVTGVTFLAGVVGTKRLELLRQFVPKATLIAVMMNPSTAETEIDRSEIVAASHAVRQQIIVLDVRSDRDIEAAFASAVQRGAGAMLIGTGAFLTSKRHELVTLEARHALPTMYGGRESVEAGGLMSYSTSQTEAYRQAGFTPLGFSKERSPATCRSCRPPSSSS
jgi:putative tryptophan/tyrosine transport system substrate-binding protein